MAKSNYEHVKDWRKRNRDKVNAQAARRRRKNPEKFAAVARRHRQKGGEALLAKEAERARARRRNDPEGQKRRMEAFRARREAERAKIAGRARPEICDLCDGNHHLGIVFDHCHSTGRFRGWICDRCNKTLGLVKDDAGLLRAMADYLERHHGEVDDKSAQLSSIE